MLYALVILLGGGLVCCSGSPVFAWIGLELVTLGILGVLLGGSLYVGALKYLAPNAVAGGAFLLGSLGDVGFLVVGGLLLKLGLFPFYFWVAPVAESLGPSFSLWCFLAPAKLAPVWLLGWIIDGRPFVLGALVFAAAAGASLGAVRSTWWVKLSLTSTGVGGWAIIGGAAAWWLPPIFMFLYGACLLPLLGSSSFVGPGGVGVLQLLVVGGMPPGAVFWGKACVVGGLVSAGAVGWLVLVLLALSEIVSWGVYLSIASATWVGSVWLRWPSYEVALLIGPSLVVCGSLF